MSQTIHFCRFQKREVTFCRNINDCLVTQIRLLTNPKILMLDEPSEGLAPLIVRDVRDAILAVNQQGVAIVLVEQKLAIPLEISNRLYIFDHGVVAWSGTTAEFRADRGNIESTLTV